VTKLGRTSCKKTGSSGGDRAAWGVVRTYVAIRRGVSISPMVHATVNSVQRLNRNLVGFVQCRHLSMSRTGALPALAVVRTVRTACRAGFAEGKVLVSGGGDGPSHDTEFIDRLEDANGRAYLPIQALLKQCYE
jgi:hypothetical protein